MVSHVVHRVAAFLGLVLSCSFLALFTTLCKLLLDGGDDDIDTLVFLAHRQLVAALLLLPIGLAVDRTVFPFQRALLPWLVGAAAAFSLNLGGYLWGLYLTDPFTTTVMQLTIPGLGLLLGWAAGRESPSGAAVLFTALAILSVGLSIFGEAESAVESDTETGATVESMAGSLDTESNGALAPVLPLRFAAGVGVLLMQCLAFVLTVICQERVLRTSPVLSTVAWSTVASAAFFTAACIAAGKWPILLIPQYTTPALLTLLFAATAPTAGTALLIGYATRWLPASLVATASAAFVPVWTSLFTWLLEGRAISAMALLGDLSATLFISALAWVQSRAASPAENDSAYEPISKAERELDPVHASPSVVKADDEPTNCEPDRDGINVAGGRGEDTFTIT